MLRLACCVLRREPQAVLLRRERGYLRPLETTLEAGETSRQALERLMDSVGLELGQTAQLLSPQTRRHYAHHGRLSPWPRPWGYERLPLAAKLAVYCVEVDTSHVTMRISDGAVWYPAISLPPRRNQQDQPLPYEAVYLFSDGAMMTGQSVRVVHWLLGAK